MKTQQKTDVATISRAQYSPVFPIIKNSMSVMLRTGATFVTFVHLLTFRILEPYPFKNIELVTLFQINDVIIVPSN